ncbi:MAG: hypothetical protein ACREND_16320 [Gemmatimonadaceae bacterium]
MAKTRSTRVPNGQSAAVKSAAIITATPITRQRIPTTIDPFGEKGAAIASDLLPLRTAAITRVYLGMQQIQQNLSQVTTALNARTLPASLIGTLQQPDGSNAARLQIGFDPGSVGNAAPPVSFVTSDDGHFQLDIPPNTPLPDAGIALTVHGANTSASITVAAQRIAANGLIGSLKLDTAIAALPVSILAALEAIVPVAPPSAGTTLPTKASLPTVRIGDDGQCGLSFNANPSVDVFPYGVFFRLVEPRLSIVHPIFRFPIGNKFLPVQLYETAFKIFPFGETTSYIDRVPVEQPLSVDGFRDQIMGLATDGTIVQDETVPMAATLGLGYVLTLAQRWNYVGLSLGDLVYSLPLAPGEQQQIAIFERQDRLEVTESEFFSEQEAETQAALADTSTNATFTSAFAEMMNGGSQFNTTSVSASAGFSFIGFGGGAGTSSTSGGSSEWLQGQRDFTQQAAENTHSSAERQAAARRSASRTGMRMASASEQQSVTTKTITNHNHTRALTMQYWEVQRMYDVTTTIDGLQLVCLVPMQIVRFLPPGQQLALTSPDIQVGSRTTVLARYANVLKHADVLAQALPRAFEYGLTLLREFAADPTATVEAAGGMAEDVIAFSLSGTFVPCEDIYISVVTKRNTRVGPIRLTNTLTIAQDTYASRDELLGALQQMRQTTATVPAAVVTFLGSLALPQSLNRSDVVGFEISRNFRRVDYTLKNQGLSLADDLVAILGGPIAGPVVANLLSGATSSPATVHLTPSDLESALGGPEVTQFTAAITELDPENQNPPGSESYANESLGGTILPTQPLPVPAMQIGPVLRYNEVLEIEKMMQHVVRNTTEYSRTIWSSLTVEERAILLDAYTIGVSPGGIEDESQMVPLLNCVQNKLLGFYGNSMILPFIIPQAVAEEMKIDPAKIQQGLLAYQQASFTPPHASVALPTRGVLGEAVLGHCASAEKIDITRFWNWQDSPSDSAPAISPVTLPTSAPSLLAGVTAPNSLANLPPLINNVLSAPAPDTTLLQALSKNAASQQDFNAALTGAQQLEPLMANAQNQANAARQDALKSATDTQMMAMAIAGNIVGGIYGGNPQAGSNAASSITGKSGGKDASASKKTTTKTKTSEKSTGDSADKSTTSDDSTGDGSGDAGGGS